MLTEKIKKAAQHIVDSKFTTAFTGAGISVESGIPPFRGEKGIWNQYDPKYLEIGHFYNYPKDAWGVIKDIFYKFHGNVTFNDAHKVLSDMEEQGILECVITQNIDNLHQEAGSKLVHEFHGNMKMVVCVDCEKKFSIPEISLENLPPLCPNCYGLLKPDFIFFGEMIPPEAYQHSVEAAGKSEVMIVVGTTGEVMPANQMPVLAKHNNAVIIEVNPQESRLTPMVTDIFLKGKATEIMNMLQDEIRKLKT